MEENYEIEFPAPEGFARPEDVEPNQPFEVMATVRQKEDGTICLDAIDGAVVSPAEKGETDAEEAAEPTEEDFLGAVEKGMAGKSK